MSIRFCIICIWLVRQAGTLEEARFYRTPMNSLYRCSTNT
jgi:hypothetical protein